MLWPTQLRRDRLWRNAWQKFRDRFLRVTIGRKQEAYWSLLLYLKRSTQVSMRIEYDRC